MVSELPATITAIIPETPSTKTFRMKLDGAMPFLPGQFAMLGATLDGKEIYRAFSWSSAPTDQAMEFTVKDDVNAYFRKYLCQEAKIGDVIKVKGPYGFFTFTQGEASRLLLIAAGSGIAPMRSILRFIVRNKLPIEVTLLYSNKTEDDIIFRKELEAMHRDHPGLTVIHTLTQENGDWEGRRGRIDDALVRSVLHPDHLCYICGPVVMVQEMVALLQNLGVKEERIKTERFG